MKQVLSVLLLFCSCFAFGQSNNSPSTYDPHEIAITGYLQTQYQRAQSAGISSFSGGDFAKNSKDRFMIRRGRLKIDRADKYSSIVFQIDATQNGVQLMDAFIQLHRPESKALLFTAGLFNRPFGYSIVYSSGYRDFPERARVFQTLMPRERDLGAMLTFRPDGKFHFLTAELAVINGSGHSARDYDSKKDFVGNLGFKFDSLANKKLQLGFGGSFYKGSVRSDTESYFTSNGNGFFKNTSPDNIDWNAKRDYYGANLQLQYDNTFGATSFKAEYIGGTQPGVASTALITGPAASTSFSTQPNTDLYLRPFEGYYLWLSQRIAKSRFTALLAYDVYDPNKDVKETEIGANNNTTAADIKFNTLGYGMTCLVNTRVKLTVYNEHVVNDPTQLPGYMNDLKDDVFTVRLQYRW
ncbi:porin [Pedobacter heparinus]|uniref:Phosphate-selective porin O and P n=1 Tax=Pedobacter heparinus (strain ATCC 13125 / DSM 2366 / CIP 104194 / JCM 7457 / NBRC 12017 / NCIMB 9290 / NRRL B-14731 / HIM 762-3) TaxID=485917 RepID=C6Y186_PEDHD|nr:porin [Pedobacter heparinus]ACU02862.1 phosphate-selective porin O and P [Pedobacter heparinus DSM 2366]